MTSAPTAPPIPEQIIGAQGRIKAAQAVLLAANVSYSPSPATTPASSTFLPTAINPTATIRDGNYLNHLIQSQTNYSLVLTSDAAPRPNWVLDSGASFSCTWDMTDLTRPSHPALTYPSPSLILPTMSCALVLCKPTTSGSSPTNSCIHHLPHQPPQKPLPPDFQALPDTRFKFHSILPTSAKKKSNELTRPTLFITSFVIPVTESSSPPSIKGSYLITPTSRPVLKLISSTTTSMLPVPPFHSPISGSASSSTSSA